MLQIKTDILIIGSGISGLICALSLPEKYNILIVTKSILKRSNTQLAQGGVAVASADFADVNSHKQDTLATGVGLCDDQAVDILVNDGVERIKDIIDYGVKFDRDENDNLELLKEGAHSERRVLHVADRTGAVIEEALLSNVLNRENIFFLENTFLENLIVQENECLGGQFIDRHSLQKLCLRASYTVLATGGAGQVYSPTTNPLIITGDGIAAAYRAGANIRDMEFVQFHPTTLLRKRQREVARNFLISESVRGEGGLIVNSKGEQFLTKYDPRRELASRDIVAKALFLEQTRGETIYLDFSKIKGNIIKKFPVIYKNSKNAGFDIIKDIIPITPAAHYFMGGIATDVDGKTNIRRLYACGEVASVGIHGANRLASNSLLEGMVFGHRAAININEKFRQIDKDYVLPIKTSNRNELSNYKIRKIRKQLQKLMYEDVGIIRNQSGLKRALEQLKKWQEIVRNSASIDLVKLRELQNLLCVGNIIVKSAMRRKESRGAHYREDYPEIDLTLNNIHNNKP